MLSLSLLNWEKRLCWCVVCVQSMRVSVSVKKRVQHSAASCRFNCRLLPNERQCGCGWYHFPNEASLSSKRGVIIRAGTSSFPRDEFTSGRQSCALMPLQRRQADTQQSKQQSEDDVLTRRSWESANVPWKCYSRSPLRAETTSTSGRFTPEKNAQTI